MDTTPLLLSFRMPHQGVAASATWTPESFTLHAESVGPTQPTDNLTPPQRRRRKDLIADGSFAVEGHRLRATRDIEFASPSMAATMISGRRKNGPRSWRVVSASTLADYLEQAAQKPTPAIDPTRTCWLLPLHPEWANLVLAGTKRFELRTYNLTSIQSGDLGVLWVTSPRKELVAVLELGAIHRGSPKEVLPHVSGQTGLTDADYLERTKTKTRMTAIGIKTVHPIDPIALATLRSRYSDFAGISQRPSRWRWPVSDLLPND